ncbi:hypothetical protein FRC03_003936 [Tulasnella sp. 419]|nr:hypothetical protein FRC03_003936 [Tulasnella sp. 419]
MLLATWLVEFYLSKINQLDDLIASESASSDVENMKVEQAILEDDLRGFFETYKPNLDRKTTYGLILSHGRNDMYLHYAGVMGDFDKVLEYHVMEEEWIKAVDVLNRQTDLELYYRFSPTLMRNAPKETVDAWLRQSLLDPRRLIPAILQHQHRSPAQSPLAINHAIRYLQHVVFKAQSTSPTIHNLLLTLYLTSSTTISSPLSATKEIPPTIPPPPTTSHLSPEDLPLLRFLSTAPVNPLTSKPYYDLDYALRLCKQNNKLQACVHIYAQMAMWEECVELALEMGELELAKINCERAMETSTIDGAPAVDESLRKRLWLKVAKFVVQDKKDIKTAMQLLDNTPVLKIEDILPFFPDFVVIDDFKDEICTALEQYSAHIETLKAEMDEATRSAESIKKDIKELKNRFVTVEQSEKCSICSLPLLTRHFYVFPCQHTFHADCLIGQVKEYLTSTSLRKLITLQNELVRRQIANGAPPNAAAPPSASATPDRVGSPAPRQPTKQRTLLSATFNPLDPAGIIINPAVRLATSLNPITMPRNVLALAGDRLRDLVVPDALANAIGGMGAALWGSGPGATKGDEAEKLEKLREELDDLLAASCPLCEGVVAGLDKPFIGAGEVDRSWDL